MIQLQNAPQTFLSSSSFIFIDIDMKKNNL